MSIIVLKALQLGITEKIAVMISSRPDFEIFSVYETITCIIFPSLSINLRLIILSNVNCQY